MPDRFIVVPAGYDGENINPAKLQFLHENRGNPAVMNREAEIVGYTRGVEVFRGPYNRATARKLGASLPKVTVKIREEGKLRKRTYGDRYTVPELRKGQPPIKQLLLNKCSEGMTREEISKLVFKDLEYFPKSGQFIGWVNQVVEALVKENLLIVKPDGKLITSPLELQSLGDAGYPIERGPYPIYRLIRDLAEEAGRISTMEIEDAVHKDWHWTESRSSVAFWIKSSLEKEYLREPEAGVFEANEAI